MGLILGGLNMHQRIRIPLVLTVLILAFGGPPPVSAQGQSWEDALSDFSRRLAQDVRADGIGGITAGVVSGRDLVWAQGFGWADSDRRIPAGVNTLYRVGSISKSFTAVALLHLWEQGVVGLDDPVQGVLPEMAQLIGGGSSSSQVTFRHLASHTSGLNREPALEGAVDGPLEFWEEKILESIPTTSFYASPGASYRYSNIGFGILGYALGRASGIPFMELVDASIIRPLGMHSTGFVVSPGMAEQLATGYVVREDGSVDAQVPFREHVGRGYKVPNGGIYSTVGELGRFIAGLTGAATVPLLGPDTRALLQYPQTPPGSETLYSFGFFIWKDDGGTPLVGHGGSVAGYNAFLAFDPESQVGVVLLRNYGRGSTNLGEVGRGLLRKLMETASSHLSPVDIPPQTR